MKSPIHKDIDMKQIEKFGITIDYCPKSGGVWLDKGELEKIVAFIKQQDENLDDEDNVPFSGEKNLPADKQHYKERKKENPILELFEGIFGG